MFGMFQNSVNPISGVIGRGCFKIQQTKSRASWSHHNRRIYCKNSGVFDKSLCHGSDRGCFIIGYCYPRHIIYILLRHGTTDDARDWGFSSFATISTMTAKDTFPNIGTPSSLVTFFSSLVTPSLVTFFSQSPVPAKNA